MEHNGFEYVDLGLPSGTLWATHNVGANSPWEGGLYFQWGDVVGYTLNDVENKTKLFTCNDYKFRDNIGLVFNHPKPTMATLSQDFDGVTNNMGNGWNMPTRDDALELNKFCTFRLGCRDNVRYVELASTINGNIVIFPMTITIINGRMTCFGSANSLFWTNCLGNFGYADGVYVEYKNIYTCGFIKFRGIHLRGVIHKKS